MSQDADTSADAFARRPDFRMARISITARVENVGTLEQFKDSQTNRILATLLPNMVREQVLAERPAAMVARDEERGLAVLTIAEREEVARRVADKMESVRGPVDHAIINLRREGRTCADGVYAALQSRGIEVSDTGLHVEAVAAEFDGLDALERSFQSRTLSGRLRGALKQWLGLTPPPVVRPPPEPFIALRLRACLHGPEAMVRQGAEELRAAFAGVARIDGCTVEVEESPFRVDAEATPYVPYTELVDRKEPLPERGSALMAAIVWVSDALKADDASRAFAAATAFVGLLRRDPEAARLLTSNPDFPNSRHEAFPETNPRALVRGLDRRISEMARHGDTGALCDLFFEMAPAGVVQTLQDTLIRVKAGYRPGQHYDAAARAVFGDPQNALLHFSAADRDRSFPVPQRLQHIHARQERELQAFGEALAEAMATPDTGAQAAEGDVPAASPPAPR